MTTARIVINQPLPAKAPELNVQVPFSFSIQGDAYQASDVQWCIRLQSNCPGILINFSNGSSQVVGSPICSYSEGRRMNVGETWTPHVVGLTFQALDTTQVLVLEAWSKSIDEEIPTITDTRTMSVAVGEFALTIDRTSLTLPTSGQKNAGLDFSFTIQNTGDYFATACWAIKSWAGNPGPVILENVPNSGFGNSIESGELLIPISVSLHPLDTSEAWSSDHGLYTATSRFYFMKAGTYRLSLQSFLGGCIPIVLLDSVNFTVNITESSIANEWTIAELHTFKNGQEVTSRYPVQNQLDFPLEEIFYVFHMYPSSERWKGTWRGSPLRLAVHTKNIGGMMWTTNPGVTVGYYTMDSDVYVCDDGFHLNTSEKTVNNFQLEGPYPTRVQVRVYDENGQLMPTMPCIVETKGGCGGDCPPIYDPLPINCNTNEWVVPKTDDYHTSNYMTSISGQPTLDIAVRVSVDKDYTQTLNSVHMGFDTYIDFTVGPNQPPDQTDGGVDWTPVAAAIGALVGLGGLGYWLWKRKKK